MSIDDVFGLIFSLVVMWAGWALATIIFDKD